MIAAAAAAMVSGAFASLCNDDTTPAGCAVYDVTFTFKSLDAKLLKTGKKTACDDTTTCCTYFENATYKFNGIIWACEADCNMFEAGTATPNFTLWCAKAKMPLVEEILHYDGTNFVAGTMSFDILDRYSKSANKVQAFWTPFQIVTSWDVSAGANDKGSWTANTSGAIYAAGFGTFDTKKQLLKSISGNAVAAFGVDDFTMGDILTFFTVNKCDNPNPGYVDLCEDVDNWCDYSGTPVAAVAASGTWTLKYNSKYSANGTSLRKIVPSYAQY